MMNDFTIKQTADLLGFSKNAVKFQCKKLTDKELRKADNGIYYITPQGLEKLRNIMGNKQPPKNRQTTEQQPQENDMIIIQLKQQIDDLKKDKDFLKEQLQQASNRADFLTIQTLPFFKRRKALKEYNQKLLLKEQQKDNI